MESRTWTLRRVPVDCPMCGGEAFEAEPVPGRSGKGVRFNCGSCGYWFDMRPLAEGEELWKITITQVWT